jgi:sensor histidine kinase YesM
MENINMIIDVEIIGIEAFRFHMLFHSLYSFRHQSKVLNLILCMIYPVFNLIFSVSGVESTAKLGMLILINFVTAFILYDMSMLAALLYDFLYSVVLVVCESIAMGIFMLLNPDLNFGLFQTNSMLLFETAVLTQLMNYSIIILVIKNSRKQLYRYTFSEISIFLLESIVTIASLCIVVEFTYYTADVYKIASIIFAAWTLGLLLAQIGFYYLFNRYIQGKRREQELLRVQAYMEYQSDYYNQIKQKKMELRKIRHDIKNIMASFQNISEEYKKEIQKYLIENTYIENEIQIDSGTPIVDAILYDKGNTAIKKGIDFQVGIEPNIFVDIENIDLCILLGNLLDNAIEASEKSHGRKIIFMEGRKVSDNILIKISNSKEQGILLKNGKLQTSKKDKEKHGYGMENVENIIHNGKNTTS